MGPELLGLRSWRTLSCPSRRPCQHSAVLGAAPCCGSGKGSPAWGEKLQEGGLPFVGCLVACVGPSAPSEKSLTREAHQDTGW